MLVSQFNFELPRELIATSPANPRDSARLLVVGEDLQDLSVKNIPEFLRKGDVIVFNDTKVIAARLFGRRIKIHDDKEKKNESAISLSVDANILNSKISLPITSELLPKVQITLHKHMWGSVWKAFAKPARKLAIGDVFYIDDEFYARITEKNEGEVVLEFNSCGDEFFKMLDKYGSPPLPPYIERADKKPTQKDKGDYQTIYAKNRGAVAAPTAGLHFTEELLQEIAARGVTTEFVTLHVGAGTFLPMKVADTRDHVMHSEYGIISKDTADRINQARQNGGRVIAVGTTSLRLLESATGDDGLIQPFASETDIFITPGYKFKAVDMLITNFHLPESTLFMLVSAFCGLELMRNAYNHAITNSYRFYSYGDACLLSRKDS